MNNNQTFRLPSQPLTFKFKGLIPLSAFMGAMDIFFWCVTWFAMREPDFSIMFFSFSFLASVFLSVVGLIVINGRADLIIDSRGISRCLFGKELQKILWSEVQVIKIFPMFDGKACRAFNIIPSASSTFSFMPQGKISFLDRAKNMNELIDALNYYITLYCIKVEIKNHGKVTVSTHVE